MGSAGIALLEVVFAALGFAIGWQAKGLTVERRQCAWCDAPTVTPHADYCRRHIVEVQARIDAVGTDPAATGEQG